MTPVSYIQLFDAARLSVGGFEAIRNDDRGNRSIMKSAASHDLPTGESQAIASQFVAARLAATALRRYPGAVPATLADAYECQEAAIARWPDRIAGWKVARIPPTWSAQYPDERLIGPAFRVNVHRARNGETVDCPVFDGGFAAVEAEVVITVAADAPADKFEWTLEEAVELVGDLHVGVEIASSPLATLNDLGPGAVISDFGNNWGVVVGPAVRDWRSIQEIVALSFIDDSLVGRGTAFVRQGALGALAFTLGKCARRRRPLRAGDVISTGMITGVHDIRPGQRSRHVFEGCGEVQCLATRAVLYSPATSG
jgi:2-keto-4-pentenoate hydratase